MRRSSHRGVAAASARSGCSPAGDYGLHPRAMSGGSWHLRLVAITAEVLKNKVGSVTALPASLAVRLLTAFTQRSSAAARLPSAPGAQRLCGFRCDARLPRNLSARPSRRLPAGLSGAPGHGGPAAAGPAMRSVRFVPAHPRCCHEPVAQPARTHASRQPADRAMRYSPPRPRRSPRTRRAARPRQGRRSARERCPGACRLRL